MKRIIIVLYLCAAVFSVEAAQKPKNIILMIGDGMGSSQLTAGLIAEGKLNMERMPVGGLVKTFASNVLVTDSGAGGTALATGYKTKKSRISVGPGGSSLKTLFEHAKEKKKATGVAVTCSITHATPAAFMAHANNRNQHTAIADHIAESGTDVMIGGGHNFFIPQGEPDSSRKDDKDLMKLMKDKGYNIVVGEKGFNEMPDKMPVAAFVLDKKPQPSHERNVQLKDMAAKAITILKQHKKGFVLMVEGSQIDWEGHKNDTAGILREMKEFDDAVGAVLDFAEKDGNTLVIVTADHETGGMSLNEGNLKEKTLTKVMYGTKGHTAAMVPLLASGPGAEAFGGIKDNTDIGKQLIELVK